MQVAAESLLFYHPAVWWLSSRIRVEREHCCDEVATSLCGDAITYAEALVELERWRGETAALALAATGGPLLIRVRRILGLPSEDARRSSMAITLTGIVAILVCLAGASHYLRAAQERPLTPIDPDDAAAWQIVFSRDDSQMRFLGFRGRDLVRFAYQIPSARVVGGPTWMDEEILRLVVNLDQAPRADEMPGIVGRVLEERLNLVTHVEQRNVPVQALVLARADGHGDGPPVVRRNHDAAACRRTAARRELVNGARAAYARDRGSHGAFRPLRRRLRVVRSSGGAHGALPDTLDSRMSSSPWAIRRCRARSRRSLDCDWKRPRHRLTFIVIDSVEHPRP